MGKTTINRLERLEKTITNNADMVLVIDPTGETANYYRPATAEEKADPRRIIIDWGDIPECQE